MHFKKNRQHALQVQKKTRHMHFLFKQHALHKNRQHALLIKQAA
jgi:hypothetical protein